MLWEIDVHPRQTEFDRLGQQIAALAGEAGFGDELSVATAHGMLLEGEDLSRDDICRVADQLLADRVVERALIGKVGDASLAAPPDRSESRGDDNRQSAELVAVLPKAGVMDPVALSALAAMRDLGLQPKGARTLRKFWITGVAPDCLPQLADRILANDAVDQVVLGPIALQRLDIGGQADSARHEVELESLDDDGLMRMSRDLQLYLQLAEMQTIQKYFSDLGRRPNHIELETIAQTWSEHCSHKTLAGRIAYEDEHGKRNYENMLKETIFAATQQIEQELGDDHWCVSVFADNAGVVTFNETHHIAFKVETHNHPSAIEPYGGANTGLGGVIRDILGTGLGAKPICSTDVFCFAPPDAGEGDLPPGVLHPQRVMRGVVEGVRDYGNRMGIPTVNGAVYFDPRYLGNPLVFCGSVGILPHDAAFGKVEPGDLVVSIGGRTGRDGIHGATFSSAELTSESESISGGAVQIGNAIEEKKVLDVLLAARDQGLFHAVTDCGAGGFSSAVGEMGEEIGAKVDLEKAPLKYAGLSYTEIWISEAQERMVLAVPPDKWEQLHQLCASEDVEATAIGEFAPTQRLELYYEGQLVADLPMEFLHDGRPPVVRQATYSPPPVEALTLPELDNYNATLLGILGSLDVASKEWIIRQYDHEVQGGSAIKPLVGVQEDGPGDASVVRPLLDSRRGVVISCGMAPRYGELDTYHMASSAIDEAIRNSVAVGGDPDKIAILDNFCWGDCEKSEVLGSLVRAAIACHDTAIAMRTPFISGKDSLNNEFSYEDADGSRKTIAIPPTLLISAMGQVDSVDQCVTMDLKKPGNRLVLVGVTHDELGGSHAALVHDLSGGKVPQLDPEMARKIYRAMHQAIVARLVSACHDLSEGGLAVAVAEMAFAGELGVQIELDLMPTSAAQNSPLTTPALLFSQSNSRLLCEVPRDHIENFLSLFSGLPAADIGEVTEHETISITHQRGEATPIELTWREAKAAWQAPLQRQANW